MSGSSTSGLFSKEEQSILKTALAFVVLRQNKGRKRSTTSDLPYCRNLLSLPPSSIRSDHDVASWNLDHMNHMVTIGMGIATSLFQKKEDGVYCDLVVGSTNETLDSIASHLACYILRQKGTDWEWFFSWIFNTTLANDIKAICLLWQTMAQSSNDIVSPLLQGILKLLNSIYHDIIIMSSQCEVDGIVVNLIVLIEALMSLNLKFGTKPSYILKELYDSIDHTLTLFVPIPEMPRFLQTNSGSQNLTAQSKILVRLALYDLTMKLSSMIS
jgi:hypothetical protein